MNPLSRSVTYNDSYGVVRFTSPPKFPKISTLNPLVLVAGPTGSGKSALALHLALEFNGEVINCDSVQIYRDFNIGAAKLRPGERAGVPHHLIDIADPRDNFTAGGFARAARTVLGEITPRGRLPILAGGTGFYVRALIDGLFEGPARDEAIRERLAAREERRRGSLHRILSRLDPAAAGRIHRNDTNKLVRALEVIVTSKRPLSEVHATTQRDALQGYEILRLGLDPPRADLYARIDARVEEMFATGLVEEVEGLLAAGCPRNAKPFEALGYAQTLRLLDGEITREQAIAETKMMTRRYAKRQWTWFRRDPHVIWLAGFGGDERIVAEAKQKTAHFQEQFRGLSV